VARFVGAESWREIVFCRGATEGINLVAESMLHGRCGGPRLKRGDEVVLTVMEHHSNLVPWLMARERAGIELKFVDIREDGTLDMDELEASLTDRTKLVCCTHVSNVLGTINPVREIARLAHRAGALLLVDGAQSVPHLPVDVRDLGCDFLAFSGHKMLAPMGIGVLYGRRALLEVMAPYQYGGDMIEDVTLAGATWNALPWKFEAGTPNVCGAVALGGASDRRTGQQLVGAVSYLGRLGMDAVRAHELDLTAHALRRLSAIPGVKLYGPPDPEQRCGVVSFAVSKDGELQDAHLVARLLDDAGIAVRGGGHCAYPLTRRLGVTGTVRASLYLYNHRREVDALADALQEIIEHQLL
jgi:cysteine desulfurase/selenocysteine lyase